MVPISYQLYSSRHFDLDETLAMLARQGFMSVEGYAALFDDVEGLQRRLDTHGLSMPTAHFSMELIEHEPDRCLEIASTLQIDTVILPFLAPEQRPADTEGWTALGRRISQIGKPLIDAGLQLGWHNHEFEFLEGLDGSFPIENLANSCPELGLELDLAWIFVAGEDPVAWIEKFAGRIVAVHVKDRAPVGQNMDEDGWADVGYGVMDWKSIAAALKAADVPRYILEHDNPNDPERFAQQSLATVNDFQS